MKNTARNSEPARTRLFLRIKHPNLDPKDISAALAIEPEHSLQAGAVTARGVKKLYSESYWLAELPVSSIKDLMTWKAPAPAFKLGLVGSTKDVAALHRLSQSAGPYELQMISWLRRLEAHAEFIEQLIDEGGTVTLVLQRPDRTAPMTIGPALCKQLATLSIRLEID